MPVNILLLPAIPDFETLKKTGIARASVGSGFLKTAINAMENIEQKLLLYEGMEEVMDNPIANTYLVELLCGN